MSTIATNSNVTLTAAFQERHYAVGELAELWNLSPDTICRLFQNEPGVVTIQHTKAKMKRRYRTLRIPESVAQRVHRRLCNPGGYNRTPC